MNRVRLFVPFVLLLIVAVAASAQYIDYGYILWAARMKVTGTEITCANVHGNQWQMFPECVAGRGEVRHE